MVDRQEIEGVENIWKKLQDTTYRKIPELPDQPFLKPDPGTKWVFDPDMSDEFKYDLPNQSIDTKKWEVNNKNWTGRKPSYFKKENVTVEDGSLYLHSKVETREETGKALLSRGFHTWATSFVRTHKTGLYGYYEIMCRLMDSNISSSFWFSNPFDRKVWTELDVFEYSSSDRQFYGKNKDLHFKRLFNTNHFVHRHPEVEDTPVSDSNSYDIGFDLSSKRIKVGFNWQKDRIEWYLNDVLIRTIKNEYFHQPLHLQLDSETFPDWFRLPNPIDEKLPGKFRIFYVRSWRQAKK